MNQTFNPVAHDRQIALAPEGKVRCAGNRRPSLGLRPCSVRQVPAQSHPDCRCCLTLIVARQPHDAVTADPPPHPHPPFSPALGQQRPLLVSARHIGPLPQRQTGRVTHNHARSRLHAHPTFEPNRPALPTRRLTFHRPTPRQNPRRARCTASALLTAISCLGAFMLDRGGLIVGVRRSRSAAMSECAT